MTSALFVRETVDLSDATEQVLLKFARGQQLQAGDTLVVAAYSMTATNNYVFDLRDPADSSYLLNITLLADTLDAPGLDLDMTGAVAAAPAAMGRPGRTARVVARNVAGTLTIHSDGGAGGPGIAGQPGVDETFTIEFDQLGHPHREYEPPTPGQPGGNGGAGGNGGGAFVLRLTGPPPVVTAAGGKGSTAGKGGPGGKGAKTAQGQSRPSAPDGPDGQPGPDGLAGSAISEQAVSVDDFWTKARGELGVELVVGAKHWVQAAKFHSRRVKGLPTIEEADTILGLLALAAGADPTLTEASFLKAQLLNGDDLLGLPRNLDVVPDFERYLRRIDTYGRWVDGLLRDVNDLLAATSSTQLTAAQLQIQLNTLDFTEKVLEDALEDARATLAAATAEEKGAVARWTTMLDIVNKRKADLEKDVDWGGVVVVGLFALAGFVVSVYSGQTAGKLIGSIPDLMAVGNLQLSGSDKETKVLKDAIAAGGKVPAAGAKDAAGHKDASGQIDAGAWAAEGVPVLLSFAKFAADMDAATGDPELKQLVKDLAARLQEKLAASARRASAGRQVDLAALRVEGARRDRDAYATLHAQTQADAQLLRSTALALLAVVRRHGDTFLDYQVKAARAVEIYTLTDQSAALRLDRWHVHPDVELDYVQNLIDTVTYRSRLALSSSELAVAQLVTAFDDYDLSSFQQDVHYVTLGDKTHLDELRNSLSTWFSLGPDDLAGDRWEAKVVAATVTLKGVTAATPTFALVLMHGPRCTERLKGGTDVTSYLRPRETLLQITSAGGQATGAGAIRESDRPIEFWRRSVATEWVLLLEPAVVQQRSVDLSGLSEISLSFTYLAKRS
jgi:hypothetical protein